MHIYNLAETLTQLCICLFQQIMKDRWINAGCDEDELKPFVEPELDISDQKRIGMRSAFVQAKSKMWLLHVKFLLFYFDINVL